MPWGRFGDNVGLYPRLLTAAARDDAPDGAYPMMFGFLCLLAASSTAYSTDYIVGIGNIRQAGAEHHRWLLDAAVKAGLLTKMTKKVHGGAAYKLIDEKEFLHIRLKAEVEWEQQQRNDTNDLRISVPVRVRDGDLCRYCGVITHWMGKKSRRKATLDHIVPKDENGMRAPATVDTMVVACLSCNSEFKDAAGEERPPLRPPPAVPFYGPTTAKWLTANGKPTAPTASTDTPDDSDPTPGHRASEARQRPATADTARAAVSDPTPGHRAASTPEPTSHAPPDSAGLATSVQVEESDSAGAGRDGTGSSRSSPPTLAATPSAARRRRRSARGRSPGGTTR